MAPRVLDGAVFAGVAIVLAWAFFNHLLGSSVPNIAGGTAANQPILRPGIGSKGTALSILKNAVSSSGSTRMTSEFWCSHANMRPLVKTRHATRCCAIILSAPGLCRGQAQVVLEKKGRSRTGAMQYIASE